LKFWALEVEDQKKLGELIMARHNIEETGTIDLVHPQKKVPNTFLVQQDENSPSL
jgi:hypothetical protein